MSNLIYLDDIKFYAPEQAQDCYAAYHEIYNLFIYDYELCPVSEGGVVLDVGSNVGVFSRYALERGNNVICIEPSINSLPALYKNLERYNGKYTVIEKGMWSSSGVVNFYENESFPGSNHVSFESATRTIEVSTIDNILDELAVDKLDFIKMDIEGSEVEALKGAKDTIIKYVPNMALCLYHKPTDAKDIIGFVRSLELNYNLTVLTHNHGDYLVTVGYFYKELP